MQILSSWSERFNNIKMVILLVLIQLNPNMIPVFLWNSASLLLNAYEEIKGTERTSH